MPCLHRIFLENFRDNLPIISRFRDINLLLRQEMRATNCPKISNIFPLEFPHIGRFEKFRQIQGLMNPFSRFF